LLAARSRRASRQVLPEIAAHERKRISEHGPFPPIPRSLPHGCRRIGVPLPHEPRHLPEETEKGRHRAADGEI
jgi:hypothetical protein